jgi:hypothetical protein
MKLTETVRFACGDCHIDFELCVAPVPEWAEQMEDAGLQAVAEPMCCPFCRADELKPLHDTPEHQTRSA